MQSNRVWFPLAPTCSWLLILAVMALGGGLLTGVAGCNQPSTSALPAAATTTSQKSDLAIVHPERKAIHRTINQPGRIQAYEQTPVFSKIPGYVQTVNADKGDTAFKGKILAVLWVPEMEVAVEQMKALVEQADAELKQTKEMVAVAQADFKSAEAKVQATEATRARAAAQLQRTQSQFQRFTKAGREGVLGGEDVEETKLAAKASEAGLAEVRAQVRAAGADRDAFQAKWVKAQADVAVAQARLDVASKNYEQAKIMFDYRNIVAPFDNGVVTQRIVDTGHFVQPATGPKGEALFVVMRTDLMRIQVDVPEADADWVHKGVSVHIRVPVLKSYEFTGKVSRTSWSLDRTARTLLAEIDVPDPNGKLRPGMYAYATITAERQNALTLPASAVLTQGDVTQGYQTFCFIVENGKLRRMALEVGARDTQRVEVLKKQLKASKLGELANWEGFTGKEEVVQGDLSGLADGQSWPGSAPADRSR